ncbi:ribose transport system permease protein [Rhizobium leguminosarum]
MNNLMREHSVTRLSKFMHRLDPAIATAFACIFLLLIIGSFYSASFLSPEYLLQQLKVASFLGVIATGMMIVVLLGQIDLSVPWSVAVGGMMACAAAAYGPLGEALAIPFGIACGMAIGLANGIGVAYLRIPSMIITLATNAVAQGLMVVYTGGFSPQDSATFAMRYLATGFLLPGLPNAVLIWAVVGAATVFVLNRTTFGRSVYGIGNRESAAYLSGINTRRIVMIAFIASGALSAFGGALLAGYASESGAVHGRCLSSALDRCRRPRRNLHSRRQGLLSRHRCRGNPDYAAAIDPLRHADAGGRAADHLRRRHHRYAFALRPQPSQPAIARLRYCNGSGGDF